IPAGAALAASATMNVDPSVALAAGLVGGVVAGSMHLAKAGTRLLINTSPEPFSNAIASVTEDAAVFGGIWLVTQHPRWFLVLFVAGAALFVVMLPKILRGVRLVFAKIRGFFGGATPAGGPTAATRPAVADARGTWTARGEEARPTVCVFF